MANTYSQIQIHVVFAVKYRRPLINSAWKDELYKFITGIVSNNNQKLIRINGVEDHVHLLIGVKPQCNLSDLVRDIKSSSSKWINDGRRVRGKFSWQGGFGAFSVSHSHVDRVVKYIINQEEHHRRDSFKKEYLDLLNQNEIDYKDEYVF